MDNFEFNKIFAGVLMALILLMVGELASEFLVHQEKLEKPSYIIEVPEEAATPGTAVEADQPIEVLLTSANLENGKNMLKKCVQCHTFGKGEADKIGPNQWGIVGSHYAHQGAYAYSSGMKEMKGSWTFENLNQFLKSPQKFVKGTKMSFAGISKAQDRADLIAYMNTQSDKPLPLPAAKKG